MLYFIFTVEKVVLPFFFSTFFIHRFNLKLTPPERSYSRPLIMITNNDALQHVHAMAILQGTDYSFMPQVSEQFLFCIVLVSFDTWMRVFLVVCGLV